MPLDQGLESGVSALKAFSKGMEITGDNIANINSVGHKSSRVLYTNAFSKLLQQSVPSNSNSASNIPASQVGGGTQIYSISKNLAQGQLKITGDRAHLAIKENGYFQVENSLSGVKYATRNGAFRVDDRGYIVTQDGFRLKGAVHDQLAEPTYTVTEVNGELVFTKDTPPSAGASVVSSLRLDYSVSIGSGITKSGVFTKTDAEIEAASPRLKTFTFDNKGNLQMQLSNGDSFIRGQVLLMDFSDPQALVDESNGLKSGFEAAGVSTFSIGSSEPGTGALGFLQPNTIEVSNVDLTEEFANLIVVQKSIQAVSRIITTADQVLEQIVNLKR